MTITYRGVSYVVTTARDILQLVQSLRRLDELRLAS